LKNAGFLSESLTTTIGLNCELLSITSTMLKTQYKSQVIVVR
jgi:hypothetical protein